MEKIDAKCQTDETGKNARESAAQENSAIAFYASVGCGLRGAADPTGREAENGGAADAAIRAGLHRRVYGWASAGRGGRTRRSEYESRKTGWRRAQSTTGR